MAATGYMPPWAPGYSAQELRDRLNKGYKRLTKKQLEKAGMGYSTSRGYYDKENDKWGPKPEKPETKTVKLANGRYAKVYVDSSGTGYGYNAIDTSNDKEIAEYIDSASWTYAIDGCGHIGKLEYSPRRNLMRVTFVPETRNGKTWGRDDIAVYFRVPTAVFGELYWLAESKKTQASPVTGDPDAHALGIRFWDLVRIRHKREGGKYPYTVEHVKAYAKKDRPVPTWKIKQTEAEEKLWGRGSAKEQDAVEEALKKSINAIKKEGAGSTEKDQAIAAEYGNKENAAKTMDSYANVLPSKRERDNYSALGTLTDKYNYLVTHGIMDDWLNEKED